VKQALFQLSYDPAEGDRFLCPPRIVKRLVF